MVERVQKVTELNLKCDKMELGDSSKAKTVSTEFDADLTVFHGISTLVVDTINRESTKILCLLTALTKKKLTLIHFMIISDTFEESTLKLLST